MRFDSDPADRAESGGVTTALRRAGFVCYLLWIVAVVLFVLGRVTPIPQLSTVRTGVGIGAAVFAVVGALRLARHGHRAIDR